MDSPDEDEWVMCEVGHGTDEDVTVECDRWDTGSVTEQDTGCEKEMESSWSGEPWGSGID